MDPRHQTRIVWCSVLIIIAGMLFLGYTWARGPVTASAIVPDPVYQNSPPEMISQTFPFEKSTITITVPVSRAVYEGAKKTNKSVVTQGDVPFAIWGAESARSMINDPAQEDLYASLLGEFRKIRAEQNLTDDEYAELIATYVQSLDYDTVFGNLAKFPVETVYDRKGDCDDKSYLLAGLLSREGYRVAVIFFEKKHHVVVGIGADDNRYLDTGYAYLDIMDYTFVGVPVNRIRGAKDVYLDPLTIPIGDGTKIYHSGWQTRYIQEAAARADNRSGTLALAMEAVLQDTPQNVTRYQETRKAFLAESSVYTYIVRHRFDRPGVYEYLQREVPSLSKSSAGG